MKTKLIDLVPGDLVRFNQTYQNRLTPKELLEDVGILLGTTIAPDDALYYGTMARVYFFRSQKYFEEYWWEFEKVKE